MFSTKTMIGSVRRRLFSYRSVTILVVAMLAVLLLPGSVSSSTIPTMSVVTVVSDQSVTIVTHNYPADQTFAVTMGSMGSLGIDGYLVGTTNSGEGGSFTATYPIPAALKGAYQIAIRLQSIQGYYSFNWFYNNTASVPATSNSGGSSPAVTTTAGDPVAVATTPAYTGFPRITIDSVAEGDSVTLTTANFPANQTFAVLMGKMGTRGIGGQTAGEIVSGDGAAQTVTFQIPEALRSDEKIAIRVQTAHANPYYAFNWFSNGTAVSSSGSNDDKTETSGSTTATAPAVTTPVYAGTPSFTVCQVAKGKTVTIQTDNFPANQAYAVTMGNMWSLGIDGYMAGEWNSGTGGSQSVTFNIPESLQANGRIAIRLQAPASFSYNWFYNSDASVCN